MSPIYTFAVFCYFYLLAVASQMFSYEHFRLALRQCVSPKSVKVFLPIYSLTR